MGNIGAHIWTIICTIILFVLALFIWFFGFFNLTNTMSSDTLQDALQTCTYLASDDSARSERGVFVINKSKFNYYLKQIHIRQLNGNTVSKNDYKVYYLPDKSDMDSSVYDGRSSNNGYSDFSGNDHNYSRGYQNDIKKTASPDMKTWNTDNSLDGGSGYEAVRAIRIVLNAHHPSIIKESYAHGNSGTSKGDIKRFSTLTATEILQTNDKNAKNDVSNNHLADNDVTR